MHQKSGHGRVPKISRWDRPPEPHDWRWVVGHIGRALITLGLLMFGFVAYQLWGTGIQTLRAQDNLKSEFNKTLAEQGITRPTIGPITLTSTTVPVPTTVATTPGSVPDTSAAPTTTAVATTSSQAAVPQNFGVVKPGDAIAEIKIHKLDLDFLVVAGVGKKELDSGVGHFPNTPVPGQLGNAVLAGHRTSHLAPFGDLDALKPGDVIEVDTKIGGVYAYVVTDSLVVKPSDYYVVTDSDPAKATLTLITCTPKGTSTHRLVVHATLDVGASPTPVGLGEINYGQGQSLPADATVTSDGVSAGATLPADDGGAALPADSTAATVVSDGASPASGAPASVAPASVVPVAPGATATTATTTVAGVTPTTVSAFSTADDAFSQGWFSDSSAWPHVDFWAVWLIAVGYGSYRLARRRRNMWYAVLVGFVPMVIVLYFFYENVNRLLPAAL